MNILLYKQDLETFPDKDIYSIAKYYNISNKDVNDLRWEIALRHSQKNQMLTGNYFIDTDILQSLSDEDLAAAKRGHLDTLKYLVSIDAPHEQAINYTSDAKIFKYLYNLGLTPDQDTVDEMFDPVDPDISMMLAKDNYYPSQEKIDYSYITADDPELFKFFAENYGITPSDEAKHMRTNVLGYPDIDL